MALNLGILAHVDAGKTTLTERLLYAAGAIDQLGSVDAGTTQTDTLALALERQPGITIKSAVASFGVGDVTINLIDAPGHPDFIAEVERVLSVLDGAVLVISAVEGVQPQTRILMRSLERLGAATGRWGWRITDIVVTMTRCGYYVGDGPAKQVLATPRTTAADFRKLTPLVLAEALERSGTIVCQPMTRGQLEIPADRLGAVLGAVARLGAAVDTPLLRGDLAMLEAELPAVSVQVLRQQLPSLTGGEGVLETSFGGYQPIHGGSPLGDQLRRSPNELSKAAR